MQPTAEMSALKVKHKALLQCTINTLYNPKKQKKERKHMALFSLFLEMAKPPLH